jgi:prepilin-type N-terminal cleavage/methylation domain-containing protein
MRFTTSAARSAASPAATAARPPTHAARCRMHGFTLIEIMITVATLAIVAAVALPNYIEYITRSKIAEATSGLNDMRVRLEQYHADYRQYPTACIAATGGPAPAGKIYLPAESKNFAFACALTATSYTVTATGEASRGMAGFAYTIDQASNRKTTSLPPGWSGAGGASSCWITRRRGDC